MTSLKDLIALCKAREKDAQALFSAQRYDGAAYFIGYVVELALKIRICEYKNLTHYPPNKEKKYKTHDLDQLLKWSGKENHIKRNCFDKWSFFAAKWDPEMRYEHSKMTKSEAADMIKAARTLQNNICKI